MNKDLSDKEIENFSNLTNKVLKEICRISDAHNIDRDSTLKYFADMLTTFTKVATIQNYDSKQTNADRIRNMTDEELAVNMMCPNENGLAEIDCDKNDNCNCYECLLKWLRAESEDNMERLTYVAENGKVLFHPADLPDDEEITITQLAKDGRYKALEEIAERLANREQAEEQGLLLRLPCKVGDKAYIIVGKDISKQTIQRVTIGSDKILEFCTRKRGFAISDIGKKVFLTREEAEAKLKEMWKIKIIYKDKSSCTLTGSHKEIPLELAVNYFNKYVADRIIYSARYQQYPKKDYSEMDLLEKIEELWEREDIDHEEE